MLLIPSIRNENAPTSASNRRPSPRPRSSRSASSSPSLSGGRWGGRGFAVIRPWALVAGCWAR